MGRHHHSHKSENRAWRAARRAAVEHERATRTCNCPPWEPHAPGCTSAANSNAAAANASAVAPIPKAAAFNDSAAASDVRCGGSAASAPAANDSAASSNATFGGNAANLAAASDNAAAASNPVVLRPRGFQRRVAVEERPRQVLYIQDVRSTRRRSRSDRRDRGRDRDRDRDRR